MPRLFQLTNNNSFPYVPTRLNSINREYTGGNGGRGGGIQLLGKYILSHIYLYFSIYGTIEASLQHKNIQYKNIGKQDKIKA